MTRVHLICEGSTEENFANQLLVDHFAAKNIWLLPSRIGKPGRKGGNVQIGRLLYDVKQRLLGETTSYCTTLLDYYGLPGDFPGKHLSLSLANPAEKLQCIEQSVIAVVLDELGPSAACRFIPYVQMFEFEAFLFSDPQAASKGINQPSLSAPLETIRNEFASPEHINDDPNTAPSKRIQNLFNGYDKPIHPVLATKAIGLDKLRAECWLFSSWLQRLEHLAEQNQV